MLIAISLSVSRLQKWNGFLFDSLRPLHSFKSLVTSSLYLEQQASVLADYFFLLVYGISNKFTSGERYNFAYHIQTDKSETHLVTADISYPGK